jgi:heme/copper-type cytochrome/quinol oxidase subunit 4
MDELLARSRLVFVLAQLLPAVAVVVVAESWRGAHRQLLVVALLAFVLGTRGARTD